jgi:hypothetical protein
MGWITDPNGKFPQVTEMQIVDSMGYIPFWLSRESDQTIQEQLDANYPFGAGWREIGDTDADSDSHPQGYITEDGTFYYTGDPAQHPVAKYEHLGDTFFMYHHAQVCIRQGDGPTLWGRMD